MSNAPVFLKKISNTDKYILGYLSSQHFNYIKIYVMHNIMFYFLRVKSSDCKYKVGSKSHAFSHSRKITTFREDRCSFKVRVFSKLYHWSLFKKKRLHIILNLIQRINIGNRVTIVLIFFFMMFWIPYTTVLFFFRHRECGYLDLNCIISKSYNSLHSK